jgi:hypothetical protein
VTRSLPPRPWLVRGVVLLVVLSLFTPTVIAAVTGGNTEVGELRRGTVESPANGSTVVAIQGFHFEGQGSKKKPARLVSAGPRGGTDWVFNGDKYGARWFYDVDPLPNGNLLVVSTNPDGTLVYELDPDTKEQVWVEELDMHDTHDVDMYNETHLAIANMRAWNESCSCPDDRVVLYDREDDEVDWEWTFRNHYPEDTDGGYNEDWTHVNDVDLVDNGSKLLLSPRNFDQAVIVDVESKEITERLGSDGNHEIMDEQHNPDYLETEDGQPTVLVADSEGDRIVEYTKVDGEWELVWELGSSKTFNWPRDADRLPNGNTLVTDSLNHRVIEVTPQGKIVWEYYATWGPYDAERVAHGGGSNGPTMKDMGVSGSYEVTNSAGHISSSKTFAGWLAGVAANTPVEGPVSSFASRWSKVTPWIRPVWMDSWAFASLVAGLLVLLGWGVAEAVYNRRTLATRARTLKQRYA